MTRAEHYRLRFAWDSTYGRVVGLLADLQVAPGLVLDLGCGYGPAAEPLRERGFDYVGCDLAGEGRADLAARGFAAHEVDLEDVAALGDRLRAIVAGRRVAAILLLDTLEHLRDTDAFLDALGELSLDMDRPHLLVSVPNVAHYDVGAKLLMGRWDVTPTGLLDATHVQFFTEGRLIGDLARRGWRQVQARDLALYHSDQHFPADHPALQEGAPLHDLLLDLRRRVDGTANVNQFVRAFAHLRVGDAEPPAPVPTPFASVLVRTQGLRPDSLLEALTCLAAQTVDDFEVLLLVHTSDTAVLGRVRDLVALFAPQFAARVRVLQVKGGGRARPLNLGLEAATGRYVAFLDDDDLVTADWIEVFTQAAAAAPARVLRSVTVDRRVVRVRGDRHVGSYVTTSGLEATHARSFDLVQHLFMNQTPICSVALPREALRTFGLTFDEGLAVLEDWQLLLQLVLLCGVHDTGRTTSVYHRWEGADSSWGGIDPRIWDGIRLAILQRFDAAPLLLPPGSATRIARLQEDLAALRGPGAAPAGAPLRARLRARARAAAPDWAIRLYRHARARRILRSLPR